jgi:hypothetical protein
MEYVVIKCFEVIAHERAEIVVLAESSSTEAKFGPWSFDTLNNRCGERLRRRIRRRIGTAEILSNFVKCCGPQKWRLDWN